MSDLLTTRQVQELLQVDRITIYRMLQDGRLKGVKVGQQWRFARQELERVLAGGAAEETASTPSSAPAFPTHCAQAIQDLFSQVSRLGAGVIAADGQPLTRPSHPCRLCQAIQSMPEGLAACQASWRELASRRPQATNFTCHAGLQYALAPIHDPTQPQEPIGFFLAGPFDDLAPTLPEETRRTHRFSSEAVRQALGSVPVLSAGQRPYLAGWPAAAAGAIQSILHERSCFVERLQKIASLTQLT